MTEYIQIDDDNRLAIQQDSDAEDPLTWGDHITEGDDVHTRWIDGEVYGVIHEARTVFTAPDDRTMDVWDEVQSLWGCYLNDTYTAETVASEYFSIS